MKADDLTLYDPPSTLPELLALLDGQHIDRGDWTIELEQLDDALVVGLWCRVEEEQENYNLPLLSATFTAADFTLHQYPTAYEEARALPDPDEAYDVQREAEAEVDCA